MVRIAIRAMCLTTCLGLVGPTLADEARTSPAAAVVPARDPAREKALLVLEIARYVEWPAAVLAAPSAPFVVGILGDDPARPELRRELAGRRLHGRPVEVRFFANLDEVDPCPVLFVGRDKARLLPVILEFLGGRSVLTVGEREEFVEEGGVVRLLEEPDRIAFEVNLAAAERRGLRLTAPLLQHAQRVLIGPQEDVAR